MGGLERAPTIEQKLFAVLVDEKALDAALAEVKLGAKRLRGKYRKAWLEGSEAGYEKERRAIEERRAAIRRTMI